MKKRLIPWLLLFLLGCLGAPGPIAKSTTAPLGQEVNLKQFMLMQDKAVVYFFRMQGGEFIKGELCIDGKDVTYTVPNSFFRKELDPGRHHLLCRTQALGHDSISSQFTPKSLFDIRLDITVENGKIYYFCQKTSYGSFRQQKLVLDQVDPKVAQREIAHSKYRLLVSPSPSE